MLGESNGGATQAWRAFARDGYTVVCLEGELEGNSALQWGEELLFLPDGDNPRVVLDLGGVSSMDSSTIGVLVFVDSQLRRRGGWLRLARVPPSAVQALETLALTDVLPTHASVEEAVAV